MKKKYLLCLIITITCFISIYPQQVTDGDILKVCQAKLFELNKQNDCQIQDVEKITTQSGSVCFNIINLKPVGYMIISNNLNLPPVIAYSFTNNFDTRHEDQSIVNFIKYDIFLRTNNIPLLQAKTIEKRNTEWKNYLSEKVNKNKSDFTQWPTQGTTTTGGWLNSNWKQTSPYNNFCPLDLVSGSRSIAGCPAVAMGMILNHLKTINGVTFTDNDDYYHNYAGRNYLIDDDSKTLQFPSFPELNILLDTLNSHYINNLTVTNDDKAALVFACAVAATQVFTSSASGTFGVDQAYAAYNKFNFVNSRLLMPGDDNIYEQIALNIMDSLVCHLAILTPDNNSGHNVVIDGYNTNNYFHLNFGWGGTYNGWYLLPDEIPYNLTLLEGIVVNISDKLNFQDNNDVPANAAKIELPFENNYNQINPAGDIDWFKICLDKGTQIKINVEERGNLYLKPFVWLYGPNNEDGSDINLKTYTACPDSFINNQYYLSYTTVDSGYYFIRVSDSSNFPLCTSFESKIGAYLISVDTILITGLKDFEEKIKPNSIVLYNNYPNPFNPSTKIKYYLPNAGKTKLIVSNMLGQQISVLVNENQQEGNYQINFNAQNLSSGVYFYTLIVEKFNGEISQSVKKMIFLK
ncbi:MAG: C10 family peptidase [bacterium]